MKNITMVLFLIMFISISVFIQAANIVYLRVPAESASAIIERLDKLITITSTTTHYTLPIKPVVEGSTNDVLIPVEETSAVAHAIDDAELWGNRLNEIPSEFMPVLPK